MAAAAERLRAGLRASVDHAPPDARGLLPGLVIGDTSRTPADLTAAMRATGMTHLTAVSGSNVAVVTGLVLGLCVLVGVPRRLATGAGPASRSPGSSCSPGPSRASCGPP